MGKLADWWARQFMDAPEDGPTWDADGITAERRAAISRLRELGEITEPLVTIYWYEHNCEWLSKYCDEHHKRSAPVTAELLRVISLPSGKDNG